MVMTNIRHLAWVPVIHPDGHSEVMTLEDALVNAPHLKDIGTSDPIERSSLIRFLSSLTALVLRTANIERLDDITQWPATSVHDALDAINDTLDLAHPHTPFAQEWHATADVTKQADIRNLRYDRPGSNARAWKAPRAFYDDHHAVTVEVLPLQLLTRWFHDFGGNGASLHKVGLGNGAIGAKVGIDTAIFWQGPTLAHTLSANTPRRWVTSTELPAWADRTATTAGNDLAGLWSGTFNANAALLVWDGHTPTGFVRSRSAHQHPAAPSITALASEDKMTSQSAKNGAKEIYDAIKLADHHRFATVNAKGEAALFNSIRPEHGPLMNLRGWHQAALGEHLREQAMTAAITVNPHDPTWAIAAFATSKTGGSALTAMYSRVDWVALRADAYTLDAPGAGAVNQTFEKVNNRLDALKTALYRAGMTPENFPYAKRAAESEFYRTADAWFEVVLREAKTGRHALKALRENIDRAVLDAFDVTTSPYDRNPTFEAKIIAARSSLRRTLHDLNTKET